MALTPTIDQSSDAAALPSPYGWDWSATTHEVKDDRTVEQLLRALGAVTYSPGKGLQGWSKSITAYDVAGFKLGAVYFGGGRPDAHVLSTSAAADAARRQVAGLFDARTARVDTRVDTLLPMPEIEALMREASLTYGSLLTTIESERHGESCGRTLYLGAPSSAVRVRAYEKWLESPGQYVEGTNRVEVQLRPPSRVKGAVSAWTPAQTFCASKTTAELAAMLGADLAPKASLHVSRGTPDLVRTMKVMGDQYGPSYRKFMEWSGGDLGRILEFMEDTGPDPDPVAGFTARLVDTQHALDSLGARRVLEDPEPPF